MTELVPQIFLFPFVAAADFAVPSARTPADLAHIEYLLKIGGGFGMLGVICGWYLTLVTVMKAVGFPAILPVFDLSTRPFRKRRGREKRTYQNRLSRYDYAKQADEAAVPCRKNMFAALYLKGSILIVVGD